VEIGNQFRQRRVINHEDDYTYLVIDFSLENFVYIKSKKLVSTKALNVEVIIFSNCWCSS